MSIETYATIIISLYMGLFLFFMMTGIVQLWNRIRKKPLKYWWGITPITLLYLLFAMLITGSALSAYNDPSNPNYARYENWGLHEYILHDIKTFLIWLFIGILLYLVLGRKTTPKLIKTICIILLGCLMFLLELFFLLSFVLSAYMIQ